MKNTALYTLLLSMVIFSSLSLSLGDKYFEGEIHYNIKYVQKTGLTSSKTLEETKGVKMVMLFEEGSWLKKYYTADGKLVQEEYLDLAENKSYLWNASNSNIQWFDITTEGNSTEIQVVGDKTFQMEGGNSETLEECTQVTTVSNLTFKGNTYQAKEDMLYSKQRKINADWYKNYKVGNFNDIASRANGMLLQHSKDAYYYIEVINATQVIEREITDDEFKFNKSRLPLKQQN